MSGSVDKTGLRLAQLLAECVDANQRYLKHLSNFTAKIVSEKKRKDYESKQEDLILRYVFRRIEGKDTKVVTRSYKNLSKPGGYLVATNAKDLYRQIRHIMNKEGRLGNSSM